eukprot:3803879-Rhodomonas_salina.5
MRSSGQLRWLAPSRRRESAWGSCAACTGDLSSSLYAGPLPSPSDGATLPEGSSWLCGPEAGRMRMMLAAPWLSIGSPAVTTNLSSGMTPPHKTSTRARQLVCLGAVLGAVGGTVRIRGVHTYARVTGRQNCRGGAFACVHGVTGGQVILVASVLGSVIAVLNRDIRSHQYQEALLDTVGTQCTWRRSKALVPRHLIASYGMSVPGIPQHTRRMIGAIDCVQGLDA